MLMATLFSLTTVMLPASAAGGRGVGVTEGVGIPVGVGTSGDVAGDGGPGGVGAGAGGAPCLHAPEAPAGGVSASTPRSSLGRGRRPAAGSLRRRRCRPPRGAAGGRPSPSSCHPGPMRCLLYLLCRPCRPSVLSCRADAARLRPRPDVPCPVPAFSPPGRHLPLLLPRCRPLPWEYHAA